MSRSLSDEILAAKMRGMSDEAIMSKFSVSLREIELAIIEKTGVNLNLFRPQEITHYAPKDFHLETTTVWSFRQRGKWATHSGNYRGNWSPYIPRNIILRYSSPGDLVLDQFCGGGTTAIEAKLLGRRCIALDINPAAILLTRKNLDFGHAMQTTLTSETPPTTYEPCVEVGDALDLRCIDDGTVDLICTHPPYANIVRYTSGIENDLSLQDPTAFVESMKVVAGECYRVLKSLGHAAILIGDLRKHRHVVPLGFQTIETFLREGFLLKDLIIKRQHNCRTTGFWYSRSVKHNFLLLSHEYLAVFVKSHPTVPPTTSLIPDEMRQDVGINYRYISTHLEPPVVECKTTWILPCTEKSSLMDQNVTYRYGGDSDTLEIVVSPSIRNCVEPDEFPVDLVYIKSSSMESILPSSIRKYVDALRMAIRHGIQRVAPGGHLVIHTRDFRIDGMTVSPALEVWREPIPALDIREIVVVANDNPPVPTSPMAPLSITHDYLLIYHKRT